jgi:hypothetical protein
VWKGSTALSVQKLFGSSKDLALSPKQGPKWEAASLGLRSHFINCHGAPANSHFYGQQGQNFPIAHDAAWIAGKITEGTIVAVECCYGGELYDPNLLPDRQPGICSTYLAGKAYGYLGSSTIAYAPPTETVPQTYSASISLNASLLALRSGAPRSKRARNLHSQAPTLIRSI